MVPRDTAGGGGRQKEPRRDQRVDEDRRLRHRPRRNEPSHRDRSYRLVSGLLGGGYGTVAVYCLAILIGMTLVCLAAV